MAEFIYVEDAVFERLKKVAYMWGYEEDYSATIDDLISESDMTWHV